MISMSQKTVGIILFILGIAYFILAYTKVQQDPSWISVSLASVFSIIAGMNIIDK